MKTYNAQLNRIEGDDNEDLGTYKRMISNGDDINEFLMNVLKHESRFFLPPDENGTHWAAIKIEDIIKIYYEYMEAKKDA